MTDRSKFEQMLEHLINEDSDKAREIFHQLVVEKSREIYGNILAEDFGMYEGEDEDGEEDFGAEDGDIGGDETDDFIDDVSADGEEGEEGEFGDEEGEPEDLEDRIVDLEDALDELRAEFEDLLGQESGEDHELGGFGDEGEEGFGDEGEDDFGGEPAFGDEGEEDELKDSFMREYVEQVGGKTYNAFAKGGDDGQNNKSVLAKPNKIGDHGKPVKFDQGGDTKTGGTQGGLLKPSTKEENFGNVNVPGGNAGKTAFKKKEPGHGAEKKGTGENGQNTKSIIGGKK